MANQLTEEKDMNELIKKLYSKNLDDYKSFGLCNPSIDKDRINFFLPELDIQNSIDNIKKWSNSDSITVLRPYCDETIIMFGCGNRGTSYDCSDIIWFNKYIENHTHEGIYTIDCMFERNPSAVCILPFQNPLHIPNESIKFIVFEGLQVMRGYQEELIRLLQENNHNENSALNVKKICDDLCKTSYNVIVYKINGSLWYLEYIHGHITKPQVINNYFSYIDSIILDPY